jgi:hypothetical protein
MIYIRNFLITKEKEFPWCTTDPSYDAPGLSQIVKISDMVVQKTSLISCYPLKSGKVVIFTDRQNFRHSRAKDRSVFPIIPRKIRENRY